MKYKYLLVIGFLLSVTFCSAQAVIGRAEYQKSQQPAAIIELPYPPDVVEAALKDHMAKKGAKPNPSKGFTAYKNVQLALADPAPSDLYFKVERKSRKEENASVVYMLVVKKDENPATRSSADNAGMEQAQTFLNDIGPSITGYSLEQQIRQQQDEVKKAEKYYGDLLEEGRDLERKRRSIEDKVLENAQNQQRQKLEIERQKLALEAMERRRTL